MWQIHPQTPSPPCAPWGLTGHFYPWAMSSAPLESCWPPAVPFLNTSTKPKPTNPPTTCSTPHFMIPSLRLKSLRKRPSMPTSTNGKKLNGKGEYDNKFWGIQSDYLQQKLNFMCNKHSGTSVWIRSFFVTCQINPCKKQQVFSDIFVLQTIFIIFPHVFQQLC